MDKRTVNFMLLSMLIMLSFVQLQRLWLPQPDAVDPQQQDVAAELAGDEDEERGAVEGVDVVGEVAAEVTAPADLEAAQIEANVPRRLTLGSLDPAGPFRMLVTFNTRGASIERIELNSPNYRDLEDFTAYVGHLGWDDDPEGRGCLVQVVGAGTPAALAVADDGSAPGLLPGDIVTAVQGQSVTGVADLTKALRALRPDDSVQFAVLRDNPDHSGRQQSTFSAQATRRPLEVIRPENTVLEAGQPQPLSFLMTLQAVGGRRVKFGREEFEKLPISLLHDHWSVAEVKSNRGPAVEFRLRLPPALLQAANLQGDLEFVKRFILAEAAAEQRSDPVSRAYHLELELEIINHSDVEIRDLAYRLHGPVGLPTEGWWYSYKTHPSQWGAAGTRDIVWRNVGGRHAMFTNPSIVKQAQKSEKDPSVSPETQLISGQNTVPMQYAGVDAQYFTCALLSEIPGAGSDDPYTRPENYIFDAAVAVPVGVVDKKRQKLTDVSYQLFGPSRTLPPGAALQTRFEIFAGPKKPAVLAHYGLQECIVYGWFHMVARPMTRLLHLLYLVVRNYGIAIVLLTFLVRGCMFPLGRQQAMNAMKMQELAPEMKKIKEKYPSDMEKQAAAQRELFQKHNYNPLSGCLLMFFQLPVFVGLYRALSVDIDLRQAPLIPGLRWASNLAGPDMLWRWDHVLPEFLSGPTAWLGPYLNVLPLVSVSLFLVHQKLFTPPPTDEQQEVQMKVMRFMTLFMGVLFFKVPAGLCLYFITSSLWGLAERKLLPKRNAAKTTGAVALSTESKATSGGREATPKRAFSWRFPKSAAAGNGQSADEKRRKRKSRRK